jgi:hypothetical protein
MFRSAETSTTQTHPIEAESTTLASAAEAQPGRVIASTAPDSVKDAGRVHIGGGMMRF